MCVDRMAKKRGGRMILASIKPYYYYLIAEEKKKIEVRKTALKNLPQDIAFYMSKDEKSFAKIPKELQEKYRKHFGKIGMKVVCDKVDKYKFHEGLTEFNSMGLPWRTYGAYLIFTDDYKSMCLSYDEVKKYGKGNTLYGWYISDLKIYDEPKELSEFKGLCRVKVDCHNCPHYNYSKMDCDSRAISRAPQSYMFVEEIETR